MAENILHLGNHRFPIDEQKGTLSAGLSNATDFELYWSVNVECKEQQRNAEDDRNWVPAIYWDTMKLPANDWRQLVGQTYAPGARTILSKLAAMLSGGRTETRAAQPGIYLDSHENLESGELLFVSRNGLFFDIDWKFVWPDVMGYFGPPEPNEARFPGRLKTTVRFTRIWLSLEEVNSVEKAKIRLSRDVDLSGFQEPEIEERPDMWPSFSFTPRTNI